MSANDRSQLPRRRGGEHLFNERMSRVRLRFEALYRRIESVPTRDDEPAPTFDETRRFDTRHLTELHHLVEMLVGFVAEEHRKLFDKLACGGPAISADQSEQRLLKTGGYGCRRLVTA